MSEKGLGRRPVGRAQLFLLPGACALGYLPLCNKITPKLSGRLSFPWDAGVGQGTVLAWSPTHGSAGCRPGPQSSQGVAGAGALVPRWAFSQQLVLAVGGRPQLLPTRPLHRPARAVPAWPPSSLRTRDLRAKDQAEGVPLSDGPLETT